MPHRYLELERIDEALREPQIKGRSVDNKCCIDIREDKTSSTSNRDRGEQ